MRQTKEVLACEERHRAPMVAGDADVLSGLIDDDLVFTGPMGNVMTKAEDLAAHRDRILLIQRLDPFQSALHPMHGLVVVTTKAKLKATYDGHPVSGTFAYTRLWHEGEGGWRVAAGHCSRIGDL